MSQEWDWLLKKQLYYSKKKKHLLKKETYREILGEKFDHFY